MVNLTKGTLKKIINDQAVEKPYLRIESIDTDNVMVDPPHLKVFYKYRITISDGDKQFKNAFLANEHNSKVDKNELFVGREIQLNEYTFNAKANVEEEKLVLEKFDLLEGVSVFNGGTIKKLQGTVKNPILQIVGIEKVPKVYANEKTRYYLSIYDGEVMHLHTILDAKYSNLVDSNQLKKGTVIEMAEYSIRVGTGFLKKVFILVGSHKILSQMNVLSAINMPRLLEASDRLMPDDLTYGIITILLENAVNFNDITDKTLKMIDTRLYDIIVQVESIGEAPGLIKTALFDGDMVYDFIYMSQENATRIKVGTVIKLNEYYCQTIPNSGGFFLILIQNFDVLGKMGAINNLKDIQRENNRVYNNQAAVAEEFEKLIDLKTRNTNDIVDIIGIAKSASDLTSKHSNRKNVQKREIQLIDQSQCQITCTIFGKQAREFKIDGNPVIALRKAVLSYKPGTGGDPTTNESRYLSVTSNSAFQLNPEIPESKALQKWFQEDYNSANLIQLTNISSLLQTEEASSQASSLQPLDSTEIMRQQLSENELLDCNICMEPYDYIENKPCSLSGCSHTICMKCGNKIKSRICPICRVRFDTPLVPNRTILTLMDILLSKK